GRPGNVFTQSNGEPNPKALFFNNREIKCAQILQQATLLDAFAAAILSGEGTFQTPGEMGLRDVRIMESVYRSAAQGGISVPIA
ncbi:MAG: hypothetical protein AAGJ31_06840, partial [Verrucomicrobiota bacterium]